MLDASRHAHRLVPQDAFVITDIPNLWLGYGQGKTCCYIPLHHPETTRRLLDKFPNAYLVMFSDELIAGYLLAPFHRPVLTSDHHVVIYGPAAI